MDILLQVTKIEIQFPLVNLAVEEDGKKYYNSVYSEYRIFIYVNNMDYPFLEMKAEESVTGFYCPSPRVLSGMKTALHRHYDREEFKKQDIRFLLDALTKEAYKFQVRELFAGGELIGQHEYNMSELRSKHESQMKVAEQYNNFTKEYNVDFSIRRVW